MAGKRTRSGIILALLGVSILATLEIIDSSSPSPHSANHGQENDPTYRTAPQESYSRRKTAAEIMTQAQDMTVKVTRTLSQLNDSDDETEIALDALLALNHADAAARVALGIITSVQMQADAGAFDNRAGERLPEAAERVNQAAEYLNIFEQAILGLPEVLTSNDANVMPDEALVSTELVRFRCCKIRRIKAANLIRTLNQIRRVLVRVESIARAIAPVLPPPYNAVAVAIANAAANARVTIDVAKMAIEAVCDRNRSSGFCRSLHPRPPSGI